MSKVNEKAAVESSEASEVVNLQDKYQESLPSASELGARFDAKLDEVSSLKLKDRLDASKPADIKVLKLVTSMADSAVNASNALEAQAIMALKALLVPLCNEIYEVGYEGEAACQNVRALVRAIGETSAAYNHYNNAIKADPLFKQRVSAFELAQAERKRPEFVKMLNRYASTQISRGDEMALIRFFTNDEVKSDIHLSWEFVQSPDSKTQNEAVAKAQIQELAKKHAGWGNSAKRKLNSDQYARIHGHPDAKAAREAKDVATMAFEDHEKQLIVEANRNK